jgi:glycosyltransferase involved in cell wall biosynthesis
MIFDPENNRLDFHTQTTGTPLTALVAGMMYREGLMSRAEASRLAGISEREFEQATLIFDELIQREPVTIVRVDARPTLRLPPHFKLSVLMPVYNEAKTICEILERVRKVAIPKEIIVVDDGSQDGTREVLRDVIERQMSDEVRVIYHERNSGKGAAVRTALSLATGHVALIQDADLEYNPRDYFSLLEPILDGRADAVYGSRFIGGGAHRIHLFWHYVGNKTLTTLSNMFTNLNLTDMETCYKAVRTDLLKSLKLRANRFDIEPEITAKLARARARIYEVPISYSGRDYAEGKKIGWRDGVQAVYCIVKYRFDR